MKEMAKIIGLGGEKFILTDGETRWTKRIVLAVRAAEDDATNFSY